MLADKNFYGRAFEAALDVDGIDLIRPTRKGEKPGPGQRFLKPLRQIIESINDTFKGQLDLERHGGKPPPASVPASLNGCSALTAAIWHNDRLGLTHRSLIAYNH